MMQNGISNNFVLLQIVPNRGIGLGVGGGLSRLCRWHSRCRSRSRSRSRGLGTGEVVVGWLLAATHTSMTAAATLQVDGGGNPTATKRKTPPWLAVAALTALLFGLMLNYANAQVNLFFLDILHEDIG